jgi:uncharacterized protein (TIGR02145 family)
MKGKGRFFMAAAVAVVLPVLCGAMAGGCDNGLNSEQNSGNNCTSAGTCKQVTIGGVRWMAENLNIKTGNSGCFFDNASNCREYGRLYTWAAAKTACPAGWRLPDTSDWRRLVDAAGGYYEAGKKLKAKSGWLNYENGTDDFGFSALPGGGRLAGDGGFGGVGTLGIWWTDTEAGRDYARVIMMHYDDDGVDVEYVGKEDAFAVRCVGL